MTTFNGQNQRLWVASTASGQATPAAHVKEFEINTSFDAIEVTSFGDANKVYLAGVPDASGSFSGYTDSDSNNSLTGAVSQEARRFYFYIDFANAPSKFFSGFGIFSSTHSFSRDGAAEVSGSWNATSTVTKSW
jgi:hypothetical protein